MKIGRYYMNPIAKFVKKSRKEAGLTQEEFAIRSGLGLRFVRDLEQGKSLSVCSAWKPHLHERKINNGSI